MSNPDSETTGGHFQSALTAAADLYGIIDLLRRAYAALHESKNQHGAVCLVRETGVWPELRREMQATHGALIEVELRDKAERNPENKRLARPDMINGEEIPMAGPNDVKIL